MVVDLFLVYQFIKRLATPFKEWEAYKLGIIDDKGNQLVKRKDFTKQAEHRAFGLFDVVIVKLKRLLEKVPGGKTRIGSYAAALWLIKEHKAIEQYGDDYILVESNVLNELQEQMLIVEDSIDMDHMFDRAFADLEEDGAIANVVGNVAGTGGDAGEPGLTPKQMKKHKKKNKDGMPFKRFNTFVER